MEQMVLKAVSMGMEHEARQEATVFAGWVFKNQASALEEEKLQLMEMLLLARRMVQDQGARRSGIRSF